MTTGPAPYYQDELVRLHLGDCLDILPELPDNSVDCVVTDPPYGLEFMGREWDGADGFRRSLNRADVGRESVFGRASRTSPEYRAGRLFQQWCEAWAAECLRILKPGGFLLAFGGTRTSHRLGCAVEDAGFEIRDSIAWLYGCLSDDTEILTSEGWVQYDRATTEQHALAFDTVTGGLEWQQIQHVHRYEYNGEMVRLTSEHTDQLLTPNHRVVLDHGGRLPYVPQGLDPRELCSLRDGVLEAERLAEADQGALLLLPLQRATPWGGVEEARAQGPSGLDRREPEVLQGQDERGTQPGLEGRRYRVQEARQLCRRPVRQSAGMGAADGPQGRLHHGAPPADGRDVRLLADPLRGGQPREPQALGQPPGEPDSLAVEPHSQALRVGQAGGRNRLPTTAVEASRVDYAGVVWCITVPSGAFVARRNGLTFFTGNSGFPKSLDVSKAIDRQRTEDLEPAAVVARAVVAAMDAHGITRADINRHFGFSTAGSGAAQQWTTTRTDWTIKPRVPTWEQWEGLRAFVGLDDPAADAEVWRLNGRKGQPGDAWDERPAADYATGVGMAESWTNGTGWNGNTARGGDGVTDAARQWQGWGTALKPAHEPIVVARKPLTGTVAANVLRWGTGALNIDAARIDGAPRTTHADGNRQSAAPQPMSWGEKTGHAVPGAAGRWPANVALDEFAAAALDQMSGELTSGTRVHKDGELNGIYGERESFRLDVGVVHSGDSGGASRFFLTVGSDPLPPSVCVLHGMLSVCESANGAAAKPAIPGTARAAAPGSLQLPDEDSEDRSPEPASTAESSSPATDELTVAIAHLNVPAKNAASLVRSAASAVNLCGSCATAIVRSAVLTLQGLPGLSPLGLASTHDSSVAILSRSLALVAEDLAKCDTTSTTTGLTTSLGCAVDAISTYITRASRHGSSGSDPPGPAIQPRMFYTAKASTDERITYQRAEVVGGGRVAHPT